MFATPHCQAVFQSGCTVAFSTVHENSISIISSPSFSFVILFATLIHILWQLTGFYVFLVTGWSFPGGSVVQRIPCQAGDIGLIPGLGRCPGEGNGKPFQNSCLGNPMDIGTKSYRQWSLAGYSPWGRKTVRQGLETKQQQ